METLGVDLGTRVKSLEAKEIAGRHKCKVRFSPVRKNQAFQKSYMKMGKVLPAGMVPARTWRLHAVEITPNKKIKHRGGRRQQQRGRKNTTSLSLFVEAVDLEVEEELSTMATQTWAEGA